MHTVGAFEAKAKIAELLDKVTAGETVLITKNGRTVAEIRPRADDPRQDPEWRSAYEEMLRLMKETPVTGYRVGKITKEDKYGDVA